MNLCSTCGEPPTRSHQPWCEWVEAINKAGFAEAMCQVQTCWSPHHARGVCKKHYDRGIRTRPALVVPR